MGHTSRLFTTAPGQSALSGKLLGSGGFQGEAGDWPYEELETK